MLTLHHFTEAFGFYQQDRLPFRLLQDQAAVLVGLCRARCRPIADALNVTDEDVTWLLQQPESAWDYANFLGGYVHVCETEADLAQVQGCDFDWANTHGGKWPCVTDMPIAWDDCRKLQEATAEPQWAIFLICWNDAGGPVYYIPKHLWQVARLDEHISATNVVWQGNAS